MTYKKYLCLEFTDELTYNFFLYQLKERLGEGVNSIEIFETKEQLIEELKEVKE